MPYISNPFMPKVRRLAVNDVLHHGLSQTQVARKYGVTKSAICKWIKKASPDHREYIPTLSSKPKSHPQKIDPLIIKRIIELRTELNRCAPVIHAHLQREDIKISLASVGRILKREGMIKKKKQAVWDTCKFPRPLSTQPGSLVQMDTIHLTRNNNSRFYIYSVIDTFTRLAYAEYQDALKQNTSVFVIQRAIQYFGFPFAVVQTDNGSEFKQGFEISLRKKQIQVRHSRVRKPNDNAHVERFNRTIQEECFDGKIPEEKLIPKQIEEYLRYYNYERLHLSLNCMTPFEFVSKLLT